MRVWQCTSLDPQGLGGVETHISSVSTALRERGHEVHIGLSPPNWINDLSAKPCILHTHGDAWPSIALLRLARKSPNLSWVTVAHGTSIGRLLACGEYASLSAWKGTFRDYSSLPFSDATVAVSNQVAGELRRYFRVTHPIKIVPNGVDPCTFSPLERVASEPLLAFVGRSSDRVKNAKRLIEACRAVHARHADFKLLAFPGFNLNLPFVEDRGRRDGKALRDELARCRALILVSLYESDGIVLREAQSLGLPVVASRTPAIEENLRGYAESSFVDPFSIGSIAKAIEETLYRRSPQKPEPRTRTWSQVAAELEEFYLTISASSR